MNYVKLGASFAVALSLTACATWTTGSVDTGRADAAASAKTSPDKILITDADMVDRQYKSLGDITVTVNKTTIFNANPTPAQVNEALRLKASDMGADGVILVRYGTGGVSFMSWGSLEGKGRAIKFIQ